MEQQLGSNNQEVVKRIQEIEAMLEAIDSEIVGVGENITDGRLRELNLKKGRLTREIAELKGEKIDDHYTTGFNAKEEGKL